LLSISLALDCYPSSIIWWARWDLNPNGFKTCPFFMKNSHQTHFFWTIRPCDLNSLSLVQQMLMKFEFQRPQYAVFKHCWSAPFAAGCGCLDQIRSRKYVQIVFSRSGTRQGRSLHHLQGRLQWQRSGLPDAAGNLNSMVQSLQPQLQHLWSGVAYVASTTGPPGYRGRQ